MPSTSCHPLLTDLRPIQARIAQNTATSQDAGILLDEVLKLRRQLCSVRFALLAFTPKDNPDVTTAELAEIAGRHV